MLKALDGLKIRIPVSVIQDQRMSTTSSRASEHPVDCLLVRLEVVISREKFSAQIALEPLLLGVSLDMALEVPGAGEGLGTLRTIEGKLLAISFL